MANCTGCGKYCGAKPVARCPHCPTLKPVPAGSAATSGFNSSLSSQGGTEVPAAQSYDESLARLQELENELRASSVETLGRDIFEAPSPETSPLAADPSQAIVEVFNFGNQGGDWQEYSDERIDEALEQALRATDPAERVRLIQIATGYGTAASMGMWHQSQAMRAAGMDPYENYDPEDRVAAEKLEEMAARDWGRNQQGVSLDQWELPKTLALAFDQELKERAR